VKHRPALFAALLLALVSVTLGPSPALVFTEDTGTWPKSWPEELEPLRERAHTVGWATGQQMNVYNIPFEDPDEFEALWPVILSLKSKGGTLTLRNIDGEWPGWPPVEERVPTVRISAPAGGISRKPEPDAPVEIPEPAHEETYENLLKLIEAGKAIEARPPWPESAHLPNGELAEFVTGEWVDGRMTWVAVQPGDEAEGSLERARVDIALFIDNYVIDLNYLHLPDDTRIIDKRGLPAPE